MKNESKELCSYEDEHKSIQKLLGQSIHDAVYE
jgi:hypothetical protein